MPLSSVTHQAFPVAPPFGLVIGECMTGLIELGSNPNYDIFEDIGLEIVISSISAALSGSFC